MRDYGKVFSQIWESDDFRSLSEDGRTLVLYLLTCKHATIAGVFRLPDGYACEDLQWSPERVSEGFANVSAKGFATRCGVTKWVWVTKHLQWNPPENPNQRKAAAKVAMAVPDQCGWKRDFMRVCGPSLGLEASSDPPVDNKPLSKGSATLPQPETGTGTGTETGEGAASTPAAPADRSPPAASPPPPPPKQKRKSPETPLPEGFGISERVRKWAAGKGFGQLDEHLESFLGKARAKDYRYVNWDEAFMTAIREDWAKLRGKQGGAVLSPVAANGAPDAEETARMLAEQSARRATKPPPGLTLLSPQRRRA